MLRLRLLRQIPKEYYTEIIIRIVLLLLFIFLEYQAPFNRKIHPEELWLYKNPKTLSYIPAVYLWPLGICVSMAVFALFYLINRNSIDLIQAHLAASLSMTLDLVVTDVLKLLVGRPRPDFFWRCFPNGEQTVDFECNGDPHEIQEGRKSFPSGHSSFAFASLGFVTLYLCGKLHVFNDVGRGHAWRLILSILPSIVALTIAVSRTCDYHHHWQDIFVGSLIGCSFAYLSYRQYYPPLSSPASHLTYVQLYNSDSENGPVCLNSDIAKGSSKWI